MARKKEKRIDMNDALALSADIEKEVMDFNGQAQALVITDPDTYLAAGELFTAGKRMIKEIEAFFKPLKQAQDAAKKKLLDAEKAEISKVQPGIDALNKVMTAWNIEQERIRREEETRLREEAQKREEEERLRAALEAEAEGDSETAAEILENPAFIPPPVVEKAVTKVAGATMATTWKHKVDSLLLLCKAVAEGKAPITCIQANDVFLGQQARAGKGEIKYPGVTFYPEQGMRGTRG